ncbi:MAG: amidohydrolase [Christensenellales bacterium]
MGSVLFVDATIVTPSGTLYGCLGVKDKSISYIGRQRQSGYDRVIDAKGCALIPGFVNTHSHLPMTVFRNHADDMGLQDWLHKRIFPMEDRLTEDSCYWASLLGIAEMLRCGVTAVNDMYMFPKAVGRALYDSGMRGAFCRAVVSHGGYQERLKEAVEIFRQYDGLDGRLRVTIAPHAEYTCDRETLQACLETAQKLGAWIHIHASETEFEVADCKKRQGMSPIAYLNSLGLLGGKTLLAHCVHTDNQDIELLAQSGASVLHCPGSNLKLGSGIAPVWEMYQKGVHITIGTDGAASNNDLNMIEEMRLAALLQKGVLQDASALPAALAFDMATVNGAKALGFEQSGSLQMGKAADLAMVSLENPNMIPLSDIQTMMVYSAGGSDVMLTMVAGEILYHNGEFTTIDIQKAAGMVRAAAREIC